MEKTLFCGEIRGHWPYGDAPEDLGGNDCALLPVEGPLVTLGNCVWTVITLVVKQKSVVYEGMSPDVESAEALCKVRNTLRQGAKGEVVIAD